MRHNELKHANSARIFNKRTKTNPFSYKSHNKIYDYKMKFDILNQTRSHAPNDEFDRHFPDVFDLDIQDIKIIKVIDQLIRPFEKLEELLIPLDEHTRGTILLNSLNASLKTSSPVNSMNDTVELYHSMNGIKRIAYYMDVVNKESFNDSVSVIKEKIRNSYIFKRANN